MSSPGNPTAPLEVRPRPIREAFASVGAVITLVGTIIGTLVSLGVIDAAQGTALENVANGVPVVVNLVILALAAFGVTKRAEKATTPTVDPATTILDRNGDPAVVSLIPDPVQLQALGYTVPDGRNGF